MKNEMKKKKLAYVSEVRIVRQEKKEPCALNKKRKGRSLVGLGARTLHWYN